MIRRTLRRQRPRVAAAAALLAGHQACEALVPLAIGLAIDASVATGDPTSLLVAVAGFVLLFTALTTCYRWFARFGQGAVLAEGHLLRTELTTRVLSPGGIRRRHGELLTIASSDADQSSLTVIRSAGIVGAASALLVSAVILIGIDVRLGVGLIVTAVVVTLGLNVLSPLIARRVEGQQESLATASALATDLVTGLRVLHGLGVRDAAAQRYRTVSRAAQAAGIRAGTAKALQQGATVLAATIVLAVSVAAAGLLALDGSITIGAFVAAVGAAQFIAEPLTAVGIYLAIGAGAKASADRVAGALADEGDDEPAAPGPADVLGVRPGELVGVVATPDAAQRIVDAFAGGTATVGEHPAHVEPHRPDLFAGTVADNVALGGSGTREPREAVEAAGAAEFVDALPSGLDEPVRDRGLSLSGGQRQRLALARALHADPPVLVLVDPTTAVDSVTEELIADGIRRLRHDSRQADRTTVLLTTSPVLLARTDRVVVVGEDGGIHAGTHHDLLVEDGPYRERVLG